MMMRVDAGDVAEHIARLGTLGLQELRDLWRVHFVDAPPASQSAGLLRQEIAWRLQAQIYGDLDSAARRQLQTIARWRKNDRASLTHVTPGSTLVKEWNGVSYAVSVVDGGYVLEGEVYPSLSAVARKITGVRWSGPRFFGLKGQKP